MADSATAGTNRYIRRHPARPVPSLATDIGGIGLERPAMLASGVLGISVDVFSRLYRAGAGAVVTKSLSCEPWEGYANPTMVGLKGGGWLNAVGLSNPGAREFARMLEKNTEAPVIVSLVGSTAGEFESMISEFAECRVAAYEINLSCPHVARVGLEVGDDHALVSELFASIKKSARVPIIAKVGLGSDYLGTVDAAVRGGADAITAINTVRAMAIDVEAARPVLSNGVGGLSGPPIKPIGLRCVYEISSKHDIPIIGCGGISTWEDAVQYILAGARAVQVGSAMGDAWMSTFDDINRGLSKYMERKGYSSIAEMVGLAH